MQLAYVESEAQWRPYRPQCREAALVAAALGAPRGSARVAALGPLPGQAAQLWIRLSGQALLRRTVEFAQSQPTVVACVTGVVKAVVADVFVQHYVEGMHEIDTRRTMAFGLFGVAYLGVAQSIIYCRVLPSLFPAVGTFARLGWREKLLHFAGQRAVIAQVMSDVLFVTPCFYYPAFYACISLAMPVPAAHDIPARIAKEMPATVSFWGPVQLVNYGFLPVWCRLPFMAATGLVWLGVLSMWRGADERRQRS